MPLTPHADLLDARARLRTEVDALLSALERGVLPSDAEREHVDRKEEAGRRGSGGVLLPGEAHNLAAAEHLAREVACFANTPGGGALVVGVEDRTGALLGAGLDVDWLRHRIYQRVDVAPAVEERFVAGVRLLVTFAALGSYAVRASTADLVLLGLLGLVGWAMRRFGYPIAPLVIGLILGPIAEESLRRALAISQGDPVALVASPFAATVYALLVVLLVVTTVLSRRNRSRRTAAAEAAVEERAALR